MGGKKNKFFLSFFIFLNPKIFTIFLFSFFFFPFFPPRCFLGCLEGRRGIIFFFFLGFKKKNKKGGRIRPPKKIRKFFFDLKKPPKTLVHPKFFKLLFFPAFYTFFFMGEIFAFLFALSRAFIKILKGSYFIFFGRKLFIENPVFPPGRGKIPGLYFF